MNKHLLGAALVLPLLVACSSDDPVATAEADVVHVKVSANAFDPPSIKVKVGKTVRWTWAGGEHNVVSGPDCGQADGVFRSGAPQAGGTFERIFDKAGTFPYNCELHCAMGMKGEVIAE